MRQNGKYSMVSSLFVCLFVCSGQVTRPDGLPVRNSKALNQAFFMNQNYRVGIL